MTFLKRFFGKRKNSIEKALDMELLGAGEPYSQTSRDYMPSNEGNNEDNLSKPYVKDQKEDDIYPVVEREILPQKIICPDCGGITLEGLDFCDKCGGEL